MSLKILKNILIPFLANDQEISFIFSRSTCQNFTEHQCSAEYRLRITAVEQRQPLQSLTLELLPVASPEHGGSIGGG